MIRAIYRDGKIQPIDGIPADWHEGDELFVEAAAEEMPTESFEEWVADLRAATEGITDEDHQEFMAALEEVERQSKELGRRESERLVHLFDDDPRPGVTKEAG